MFISTAKLDQCSFEKVTHAQMDITCIEYNKLLCVYTNIKICLSPINNVPVKIGTKKIHFKKGKTLLLHAQIKTELLETVQPQNLAVTKRSIFFPQIESLLGNG